MSNAVTFADIKNAADASKLIGAGTEGAALVAFIGGRADKLGAILADAYAVAYRCAMNYGAVELARRVTAACTDKKGAVSKRPAAAAIFETMDSIIKGAKRAKAQAKDCPDHEERAKRAASYAVTIVQKMADAIEADAAERKDAAAAKKAEKASATEAAEKAAAAETADLVRDAHADMHEAKDEAATLRAALAAALAENDRLKAELASARAMLATATDAMNAAKPGKPVSPDIIDVEAREYVAPLQLVEAAVADAKIARKPARTRKARAAA